jgi:hypothetical protein
MDFSVRDRKGPPAGGVPNSLGTEPLDSPTLPLLRQGYRLNIIDYLDAYHLDA